MGPVGEQLRERGITVTSLVVGFVAKEAVYAAFEGIAADGLTAQVEVRASWTPVDDDLAAHFEAWTQLLCTLGGLPPLPEGVALLTSRR